VSPAKFRETCCAPLADIRAGKWTAYAPRPVRIVSSRIIQLDRTIGPVYFALKASEFILALLASIGHHERVYVVMVPTAAEYADRWPEWPRVVSKIIGLPSIPSGHPLRQKHWLGMSPMIKMGAMRVPREDDEEHDNAAAMCLSSSSMRLIHAPRDASSSSRDQRTPLRVCERRRITPPSEIVL